MGGTIQKVTVNRSSEKELDKGIAELESRGYELVKRDTQEFENKDFHYKEKLGKNYHFGGWVANRRHTAEMRRVWYG